MRVRGMTACVIGAWLALTGSAQAGLAGDDLYRDRQFAGIAGDQKASQIGDSLSVIVYQSAEARNSARSASRRRSIFEGGFSSNSSTESGQVSLGGNFDGRGEVRRSESFVTQISVTVEEIAPNGDLLIAGEQLLFVNGEETTIAIRGRVRPVDISADNEVLSTRVADAEINYDGQGFVSRTARPGLIHAIFNRLGLG